MIAILEILCLVAPTLSGDYCLQLNFRALTGPGNLGRNRVRVDRVQLNNFPVRQVSVSLLAPISSVPGVLRRTGQPLRLRGQATDLADVVVDGRGVRRNHRSVPRVRGSVGVGTMGVVVAVVLGHAGPRLGLGRVDDVPPVKVLLDAVQISVRAVVLERLRSRR